MILLLLLVGAASGASVHLCADGLALALDAASMIGKGQSTWGVLAYTLHADGSLNKKIVELNSQRTYAPASNTKVITTAAYFLQHKNDILANMSFSSDVYIAGEGPSHANEVCVGDGGNPSTSFEDIRNLAKEVAASYSTVDRVSVQSNMFTPIDDVPGDWEWGDLVYDYGAQPSSVMFDTNAIVIKVTADAAGNVTHEFAVSSDARTLPLHLDVATSGCDSAALQISNTMGSPEATISGCMVPSTTATLTTVTQFPAQRFADALQFELEAAGVTVTGERAFVRHDACPGNVNTSLEVTHGTISDVMNWTLQESDNTWAELFLRHLGTPNASKFGSTVDAGLEAVRKILGNASVDTTTFYQADGCGLSRHNLISPQAMIEILVAMYPYSLYKAYLPRSGMSGTLIHRLNDGLMKGRVHAKTGTMSGTNALSGYIDRQHLSAYGVDEDPIVFSIITTGSPLTSSEMRAAMDALVTNMLLTNQCACDNTCVHGTCTVSGCACDPGYSGDTCEPSPPSQQGVTGAVVVGIALACTAFGAGATFAVLKLIPAVMQKRGYEVIQTP